MTDASLETDLDRWVAAGVLEPAAAGRIREFESSRMAPSSRVAWPVGIVVALGGLLLGAGALLFVAAHWDALSPGRRFALAAATLVALHLAAARSTWPAFRTTLHAVGTVALGGGIYLVGQIFNLQADWPTGILLWALGALAGALALRDWPQSTLLAILAPAWLAAEWELHRAHPFDDSIVVMGLLVLAVAYLFADAGRSGATVRRAIGIVGALAVLPFGGLLAADGAAMASWRAAPLGTLLALGIPMAVAGALGRPAFVAALGTGALTLLHPYGGEYHGTWPSLLRYLWCAGVSLWLVVGGFRERSSRAINMGVAAFALTVGVFYCSSVMDKLDRAASLAGLGLLFLGGGFALERARRRLVARATEAP